MSPASNSPTPGPSRPDTSIRTKERQEQPQAANQSNSRSTGQEQLTTGGTVALPGPSSSAEDVCSVCREVVPLADRAQLDPCGHRYHLACISQWFTTIARPKTCPLCRSRARKLRFSFQSDQQFMERNLMAGRRRRQPQQVFMQPNTNDDGSVLTTRRPVGQSPQLWTVNQSQAMTPIESPINSNVRLYGIHPVPVVQLISMTHEVQLVRRSTTGVEVIVAYVPAREVYVLNFDQLTSPGDFVVREEGTDYLLEPSVVLFSEAWRQASRPRVQRRRRASLPPQAPPATRASSLVHVSQSASSARQSARDMSGERPMSEDPQPRSQQPRGNRRRIRGRQSSPRGSQDAQMSGVSVQRSASPSQVHASSSGQRKRVPVRVDVTVSRRRRQSPIGSRASRSSSSHRSSSRVSSQRQSVSTSRASSPQSSDESSSASGSSVSRASMQQSISPVAVTARGQPPSYSPVVARRRVNRRQATGGNGGRGGRGGTRGRGTRRGRTQGRGSNGRRSRGRQTTRRPRIRRQRQTQLYRDFVARVRNPQRDVRCGAAFHKNPKSDPDFEP